MCLCYVVAVLKLYSAADANLKATINPQRMLLQEARRVLHCNFGMAIVPTTYASHKDKNLISYIDYKILHSSPDPTRTNMGINVFSNSSFPGLLLLLLRSLAGENLKLFCAE